MGELQERVGVVVHEPLSFRNASGRAQERMDVGLTHRGGAGIAQARTRTTNSFKGDVELSQASLGVGITHKGRTDSIENTFYREHVSMGVRIPHARSRPMTPCVNSLHEHGGVGGTHSQKFSV